MTKRPRGTPANLTGVIENSRDAWDKLWWNLQQFEYALSERSHLGAAQAYALIDYAVAESALHAWVLADYLDGLEPGSTTTLLPTSPREAGRNLISRVKWSGAL